MTRTLAGFFLGAFALAFAAFGPATAPSARADDLPDAEEMIERARFTVQRIANEQDLRDTVPRLLARAKGVMIFPNLLKGAFLIGGEGGSGVLMARDESGTWSHPSFYTLGAISFGIQIGGQASEAVIIIMTDKALQAILDNQVKLGGDVSAAAGPVGVGYAADTTTNLGADVYTYSTAKGLFVGASLEGAVTARREDWNKALYGPDATSRGIVLHRRYGDRRADALRETMARITGR
jgi:SH3 domain-containing YSC84-like protein 1